MAKVTCGLHKRTGKGWVVGQGGDERDIRAVCPSYIRRGGFVGGGQDGKPTDDAPEEEAGVIEISTSDVDHGSTARQYADVDCAGHADYEKNMVAGGAQ